jgi:predicted permease
MLKEHAIRDGRRPVRGLGFLRSPRSVLIVTQIALSLVLLTAGGLFVRGALAAAEVNPGFSLDSQLVVGLYPSLIGYSEQRSREIYTEILQRLRSLPEVGNASLASVVPLGDLTRMQAVQSLGAAANDFVAATYYVVSDDYFESLRLPLLRGRGFTAAEGGSPGGSAVAIIDQPLAQRLFGEADAVGKRISVPSVDPSVAAEVLQIVGVVPGTRHRLFDRGAAPHLYVPFGQHFQANMFVHVRIAEHTDPIALLGTIRGEIRAIDSALPVLSLMTLSEQRDRSVFLRIVRVGGDVFATLGILALLLAVVGVYGVKAFAMVRRTHEIGVRMALGATSRDVVRQMVSESLALTIAGIATGLVLAIGTSQLLRSVLFEVSAVDPVVFLSATVVLATAATLAAYLPARRASRIQPTAALRHE